MSNCVNSVEHPTVEVSDVTDTCSFSAKVGMYFSHVQTDIISRGKNIEAIVHDSEPPNNPGHREPRLKYDKFDSPASLRVVMKGRGAAT